jgi:glycosyltransferase involved in cell wall biosynthesis
MEKKECMVSIWCLCYNHAEYIAQTLDSFLEQETDFPFEIIISDDASTDGSADIIRSYAERYPEIIRPMLLTENVYSTGKNMFATLFFDKTCGKYVAVCEGDDHWTDKTKLQRQVDWLEANPEYSLCVHNTTLHYCGGEQPDRLLLRNHTDDHDISFATLLSGTSYSYHTSAILCRREVICNPPEFYFVANANGFVDYAIALWCGLNGKVRYLNRPMSLYRINSSQGAWSWGVDKQYKPLRRFIRGEIGMLRALLPLTEGEKKSQTENEILEKEFELMYIEGRDIEQRKAPYSRILKNKPLKYRVNNFLKSYVPGLSKIYRRMRGYID